MGTLLAILLSGCNAPDDDSKHPLADSDGDGFFDGDDCNDGLAAVHPGADEICDGMDNDCDGDIDVGAIDATAWYADADGDTFGAGKSTLECHAPDERSRPATTATTPTQPSTPVQPKSATTSIPTRTATRSPTMQTTAST